MNLKCRAAYFSILGNYAMNKMLGLKYVDVISSTVFDFYGIWHAGQEVDFVAEFVLMEQNPSFYEVNE